MYSIIFNKLNKEGKMEYINYAIYENFFYF